jgi:hypothetical protein
MKQTAIAMSLLVFGLLACDDEKPRFQVENVDRTMRILHPGTNAELHTTLSALFDDEMKTHRKLLGTLADTFKVIENSPSGVPTEIYAAEAKLKQLRNDHASALVEFQTPVSEAKALLASAQETAAAFSGTVKYYGKKPYCGSDGCGGECNSCAPDQLCYADYCRSTPLCADKACGPNGVGGVCGICGDDERCTKAGKCVSKQMDETAEVCEAQCKPNPRGRYTKTIKRAGNEDVPGPLRGERRASGAAELSELKALADAVATRIEANKSVLQEKAANDVKVSNLSETLASLKAQITEGKAAIKRLKAEQKAAKKAVKAAAAEPLKLTAAQAALESASASLTAAVAQDKALKQMVKDTKAQAKAAAKAQKATSAKAKVAVEVQPHLSEMARRYKEVIRKWELAQAAVDKAKSALVSAEETAAKKTEAANTSYEADKAAAEVKRDALLVAAIAEESRPTQHSVNNLTHGVARPAYVIPDTFLKDIATIKVKYAEERTALLAQLAAMANESEKSDEGPSKNEIKKWIAGLTAQLEAMDDIELILPALEASNGRASALKTNLRDLVEKVRLEAGL